MQIGTFSEIEIESGTESGIESGTAAEIRNGIIPILHFSPGFTMSVDPVVDVENGPRIRITNEIARDRSYFRRVRVVVTKTRSELKYKQSDSIRATELETLALVAFVGPAGPRGSARAVSLKQLPFARVLSVQTRCINMPILLRCSGTYYVDVRFSLIVYMLTAIIDLTVMLPWDGTLLYESQTLFILSVPQRTAVAIVIHLHLTATLF
ncbi:hypothetical protein EVAR_14971_1 [Eumeta japonica]|uniref:Uncharacterized protein n=1 Tax=Eumeta variegata TaxID=151549 RepID=A0A4C1XRE4_EUMVA|nr:hypothetical protein EVAR_14971_1 [Eumeta japonica]